MGERPNPALLGRQAQWDALRNWRSSQEPPPIPLEERIEWYIRAWSFSQAYSRSTSKDIAEKLDEIRHIRECLAHLTEIHRDV